MKVLIAGIGNLFMGDDGFGCAVARRLRRGSLPQGVEAHDFGIRDLDLCYALTSGEFDLAILVDAIFRGDAPGTLHLIEPAFGAPRDGSSDPSLLALHAMNPHRVLSLVAALGAGVPRLLMLACEPRDLGGDEGKMGLSEVVEAAVATAVMQIFELVGAEPTAGDAAPGEAPI
jgi:hydrogenase maturation protease